MYVRVQNELAAAYNEIRNEVALERFGERYIDLNKSKQKEIRKEYPQKNFLKQNQKIWRLICQSLKTKIIKEPQLFLLQHYQTWFMLLFFFMVTTVMRETTLFVEVMIPKATEIKKMEKKSLVSYIRWATSKKNAGVIWIKTKNSA